MRPGRRITGESGLINTAKLQVLGQIEKAKPRADDMMTFQISLYSVEDPELLKDGADSSHHLRETSRHVITTKATTTSRTEN
ncbi:hypothetical protein D5086_012232 [Populus alba]|uniref:Uncharacterized protein n=2 Tax=Populus TaxID=3689 RepID=A0ACC4C364_POPAL|nr:hypothetical protein NC653_015729 [Populus alba x Populus x berolinensis]